MAYDKAVAERIREAFSGRKDIIGKKMFDGVAFMHRGNMCCGVTDNLLMARLGPAIYDKAPGFADEGTFRSWLDLCQDFTNSLPEK